MFGNRKRRAKFRPTFETLENKSLLAGDLMSAALAAPTDCGPTYEEPAALVGEAVPGSNADSIPQDSFTLNFAQIETPPAETNDPPPTGNDILLGGLGRDRDRVSQLPADTPERGEQEDTDILHNDDQANTTSREGQDGNDLLIVNNGDGSDFLEGQDGNDLLIVNNGDGSDFLEGQDGNDLLIVNNGDGSDFLEGQDGNDLLIVNNGDGSDFLEGREDDRPTTRDEQTDEDSSASEDSPKPVLMVISNRD